MTAWSPVWRVSFDSTEVTGVTLSNLSIRSGRTDVNIQPTAGSCSVTLVDFDSRSYDYTVGTSITIEIKNSAGTFVPLFGGYITDFGTTVVKAGSVGVVTTLSITALGALSKLSKIIETGSLASDDDGAQIYTLLSNYLLGEWTEVPAAMTWDTYEPATGTWVDAANLGLGEIDTGSFTMIDRNANPANLYSIASQIATSAFGYLYEDASGNICYASTYHRQNYLGTNGYTTLDANSANGAGISVKTKSGDIRNSYSLTYGNNANSNYVATDEESQSLYGVQAAQFTSSIKDTADAELLADRFIDLRAYPNAQFQGITFELANPELSDTERDALINVFMGLPVNIQNLPANISNGSFQGFIEGWSFQAGFNQLSININASPTAYSMVAERWENVLASEAWDTLSGTMDWLNATTVV